MTSDVELAAIVSTRICHDLVSPVGAIANGVDLIAELGGSGISDELGMIRQSAARASGLLQFYRIAFGAASVADAAIRRDALQSHIHQVIASNRVELHWNNTGGPEFSRIEARLLFQLTMCARAVLGMTGQIVITPGAAESFPIEISVTAFGSSSLNADTLKLLGNPGGTPPTPRLVEFHLAHRSASALGVGLSIDAASGTALIRAG